MLWFALPTSNNHEVLWIRAWRLNIPVSHNSVLSLPTITLCSLFAEFTNTLPRTSSSSSSNNWQKHSGTTVENMIHNNNRIRLLVTVTRPYSQSRSLELLLSLLIGIWWSNRKIWMNLVEAAICPSTSWIRWRATTKRLQIAQSHIGWTTQKWRTVLFSDESKFSIIGIDGIYRVRWPVGKRLAPWYCQSAKVVKKLFSGIYITLIEWPPHSPDITPIEKLWEIVEKLTAWGLWTV